MRRPSYREIRKAFMSAAREMFAVKKASDDVDVSLLLEGIRRKGINLDALPDHPYDRYYTALGVEHTVDATAAEHPDVVDTVIGMKSDHPSMVQLLTTAYVANGKNTFKLTPDLYKMFMRTDLHNISTSFIPPAPFECFYLDTTGCGLWFARSIDGAPVEANGLFVLSAVRGDSTYLRVMLWSKESALLTTKACADDLGEEMMAQVQEHMARLDRTKSEELWQDAHLISGMEYTNTDDTIAVVDMLDKAYHHTYNAIMRSTSPKGSASGYYAVLQSSAVRDTMSLVFNVLLFLGTDPEMLPDEHAAERKKLLKMYKAGRLGGAEITPGARKAHQRLMEISSTNVRLLTVPRTTKTAGRAASEDSSGVKLHWVRGHWRRQPYGPRDSPEYKMLWIRPHQKGDKAHGEVASKVYSW
jgi:hypothetical protein